MSSGQTNPEFSIVIPVFNEKESLSILYGEILETMNREKWSFEAIIVDDGSTDGTAEAAITLGQTDSRIRVLSFRKNYGKSAALACGFKHAQGKWVVTLDGDLQDDPKEIPRLVQTMKGTDADLVSGWKKIRKDPFFKIISSKLFNTTVRLLTGVRLHDFNCGIKLYRPEVVKEIFLYGELHRLIPALAAWKGFRVVEEVVYHRPRKHGRSKFGFNRFFAGLVDLVTVLFLARFETKPSHLFSGFGVVFFLTGILINGDLLITKLSGDTIAPRYPYMILGITILVVGIQFIFFGLLAEMIVYRSHKQEMTYHLRPQREDKNL